MAGCTNATCSIHTWTLLVEEVIHDFTSPRVLHCCPCIDVSVCFMKTIAEKQLNYLNVKKNKNAHI